MEPAGTERSVIFSIHRQVMVSSNEDLVSVWQCRKPVAKVFDLIYGAPFRKISSMYKQVTFGDEVGDILVPPMSVADANYTHYFFGVPG